MGAPSQLRGYPDSKGHQEDCETLWKVEHMESASGKCFATESVRKFFARTIMIIEYPMIGFLAMCYFFCAAECTMIKQAFSGYALLIIE